MYEYLKDNFPFGSCINPDPFLIIHFESYYQTHYLIERATVYTNKYDGVVGITEVTPDLISEFLTLINRMIDIPIVLFTVDETVISMINNSMNRNFLYEEGEKKCDRIVGMNLMR